MKQKVLITGISGFAGSYLAEELAKDSLYEIHGTYVNDSGLANIESIKDSLTLHQVDLNSEAAVNTVLKDVQPELVFHLAALAAPGDSFSNPKETIMNNVVCQLNLLEAIRLNNIPVKKILIVSSADVYGSVKQENLPIDENTPLYPNNPYALSKLTQDYLGLQYYVSYKLPIIRVRPFNHIGPRQSPHFAIPTFAKKIAEIEKGKIPPVLKVGNLDSKRDFTDVKDVVAAYNLVMQKGKEGDVYNIGSGVSHKISDVLNMLVKVSTSEIKIEVDPMLLRPVDTPELICNNRKIVEQTGWNPHSNLEQTLKDVLEYWRQRV